MTKARLVGLPLPIKQRIALFEQQNAAVHRLRNNQEDDKDCSNLKTSLVVGLAVTNIKPGSGNRELFVNALKDLSNANNVALAIEEYQRMAKILSAQIFYNAIKELMK